MHTVTVSSRFQIVIPKSIRDALHLFPGAKLKIFVYQKRIELILLRDVKKMRGALKGMDTVFIRD